MIQSETINSRDNSLLKRARAARDGRESELIFLEGLRLCEEAVRVSSLTIDAVLFTKKLFDDERGRDLLAAFERAHRRAAQVDEKLFASLSDTKTPQGIIVLAERPRTDRETFARRIEVEPRPIVATHQTVGPHETDAAREASAPLLVIMHRINNPANAGAMLRVAEASGATGVITIAGSTDCFSPKALRGAMGSTLRLPLWTDVDFADALAWCAARNIGTVGTDVRAGQTHTGIDWTTPRAIILGEEGRGLTTDEAGATDQRIKIPMRAPVESLNVAVALGVILYEAARQRGNLCS
ncbi:MAG: RNA methyltransferase [Pyrinomonadaceae bacterium]|nr:RNA methyltransferase [Pyrinomonadaceae bacterium]